MATHANGKHSTGPVGSDDDLPDFDFGSKSDTSFSKSNHSDYKYDLDSLVAEKRKKDVNQEIHTKEAEIQAFIATGGVEKCPIIPATLPTAGNMQTLVDVARLQMLTAQKAEIKDDAPGEAIYDKHAAFKLLSSATLSLKSCGFTLHDGPFDRLLEEASASADQLQSILLDETIHVYFQSLSCKSEIAKWLFYVVALHENPTVVLAAFNSLWHILNLSDSTTQESKPLFHLFLKDIARVFINYGMNISAIRPSLLLCDIKEADLYEGLQPEGVEHHLQMEKTENLPFLCNLKYIFQVLTSVFTRSEYASAYNCVEKAALVILLFHAGMDSNLIGDAILVDIQTCIGVVLNTFQPAKWPLTVCELCCHLSKLSSNHANQLHIADMCAATARGTQLQKSISFTFLQLMYNELPEYLPDVMPKDLMDLLTQTSKLALTSSGYYKLYIAVQMMDRCIGSEKISTADKASLQQCIWLLRLGIGADIRERVTYLDPTRVKDLIVRVTSKWHLMCQAVNTTQPKMFNYMGSPVQSRESVAQCPEVVPSTDSG
ncbi:PREDICTED: SMC5-SMC6 complex localization factor protein 2-like [Priapulus caudatus]|uniref:SMC5-SMC6 complex localization factor protein 2-like n=1 Tax=Priapulus caudatus TaxID=37621 RepID=A0ABM1F9B1_PRICU|nr:PREDICTED: SMC5-SMC6 complex localization factor protein 2-like [Priapulus caudatus]XP_014681032.1 PREDICTED: SMC5-SMC6 complex localization factor protein 2-like [Priapulus caudatus]XP_014681033.1 PREDICTED: SMC5-SMC6 complex localization factor protein 2-like [Priapulus caudatus]